MSACLDNGLIISLIVAGRFPNSVGVRWDNLFPSCTHAVEIDLVSNLVVYNPKNRLKATEVSAELTTNK